MSRRLVPALILSLVAGAAQARGIDWSQLEPQERSVLGSAKPRWQELSPEQQQRLRDGARRWQQLTPEQKERTKQGINRWRELPPEQQEAVKQRHNWYRDLPDDRKQQLRDNWQRLREERKQEFRGGPKKGQRGPRD
jgi:hypothetical protein